MSNYSIYGGKMNRHIQNRKGRFITLTLVCVIIFALIGGSTQSLAAPGPQTEPPFETIALPEEALRWDPALIEGLRPSQKHPKLDTHLQNLVNAADRAAREALLESGALRLLDGRVQVQISTSAEGLLDAITAVEKSGGRVSKTSNDGTFFQAWLPIDTLEMLAEHNDIYYIRRPNELITLNEVNAGSKTTEGLAAMNGTAWHTAGVLGAGTKVAVIDGGFQGYISLLGTDLPSTVTVKNFVDGQTDADINTSGGSHGLACAEIVYDIAPQAQLYLAKTDTDLDLQEAVSWAIANNVDIISTSLGYLNATPGDGTGWFQDLVQNARTAGILWVAAAGNMRESHWGGLYNDPENTDSHWYTTDSNLNLLMNRDGTPVEIPSGYPIIITLRWDDWTNVNLDYDLVLLRWTGSAWEAVAASTNDQNGSPGQTPTEAILFATTASNSYYAFGIARYNSTRNVNFEVFAPTVPHLNFFLYDRSLPNLADASSAMTVGAVDVVSPYPQEYYSSQGPTNGPGGTEMGGFTKPDIAAFANVSTVSYGTTNFAGTSAATPHVAGAAALALSAYPTYTPDQLHTFLEDRAIDMGTGGMDNIFGHGRLYLGSPPSTTPAPSVTSITPNTGQNTSSIPVSISGANFVSGATVNLTKSGQTNINATSVNVSSSTQITCNLNLSGAATSAWNVVVTNPDAQSGTLTNGFTVTDPSGTDPVITLEPQQVNSTQVSNTVVNKYLQIGNAGGSNLNWNVYQGTVGGQSILPLYTSTAIEGGGSQTLTIGDDLLAFSALQAEGTSVTPPPPVIDADQINITHSTSQTITEANSVACSSDQGASTSANQYLRTFTLADFGITQDFAVDQVTFGIENLSATRSVTVNLYTLNGAFTYANLTKIGTATTSLAAQSLSLVNVPVSGTATAGSTLVVEVAAGDFSGEAAFFIGSNALGQTAPSYLAASGCGLTEPTDTAAIGFASMHIVMNVTGTVGDSLVCDAPDSVSWVNVAPLSGVVAPSGSQSVNVAFDSTGLAANTYSANLCISSNDPAHPLSVVPLSLTVQAGTAPSVTSISPNTGQNTGSIPVTISGANFVSGATVKLTKSGQTNINATSVNVSSSTQISCNLNLSGAATGAWNVVVTNPDAQSATLTNGFTVTTAQTGWNIYLPLILKPGLPPPAPTLNAINNSGGSSSYTVSWSSSAGAVSYTLQEDDNAAFSSPTTVYEGTATSKDISGKVEGTYYYRVRATNSSGSSAWSNVRSVTVTETLPENIAFMVGAENATYYIYSSGRSFDAISPIDYPVTQVQALSYLASTKSVTFTISIKHNGTTVASWTQSVNHTTWKLYDHTQYVSFNIKAGDTLTYHIKSNQSGEGAFLHGGSFAVFYK